jgi:hypothetical protein
MRPACPTSSLVTWLRLGVKTPSANRRDEMPPAMMRVATLPFVWGSIYKSA